MRAYGRNLQWIENRQYSDIHTVIPLPSSGKRCGHRRKRYERLFRKMERQHCRNGIRKMTDGVN